MPMPRTSIRMKVSRRMVGTLYRHVCADQSNIFIGLAFVFYVVAAVVALSLTFGGSHDAVGYLASLFVLGSFGCQTMAPLRVLALLSNVAFIAYAARNQLGPVLALHALLLPINVTRLWQLLKRSDRSSDPISSVTPASSQKQIAFDGSAR
jgi:hypothetical protein